jgi:hypothetical protein
MTPEYLMVFLPLIRRLGIGSLLVMSPTLSLACTMPIPPTPEQPQIEIEIEFEDYDSIDDLAYYKVEIEVGVVPPTTSSALCQCALNLGSQQVAAPSSFTVSNAVVGVHGDEYEEFDAFAGFERDSNVEDFVSSLGNFANGASAFGFSVPVDSFTLPTLGEDERLTMVFQIAFDPDDFDEVNGNLIQFAAGSNEPGHGVNIFSGYQAALQLPAFEYSPPGDYNGDGVVDLGDYTVWRDHLGSTTNPELDADDSGEVDEKDYRIWRDNFGQVAIGGAVAAGAVPEPHTLVTGMLASMWLVAMTLKRRSNS